MDKTILKNENYALEMALGYLPCEVKDSIFRYLSRTRGLAKTINEIRLRENSVTSLVLAGRNVALDVTVDRERLKETFKRVCGGAVFAHRDDVCRGFVTLPGGVRVGVCGYARYESGSVVGVGDISSLVFRIPTGECTFARELYREWQKNSGGMLICSGAGEGKTTAIRALTGLIGSGDRPLRVVVADRTYMELLRPALVVVHSSQIKEHRASELQHLLLCRTLSLESVAEYAVDLFDLEILCIECLQTMI